MASPPHCIHPLGVVPKPRSEKLRPVLNMRHANAFMVSPPFRMESLANFANVARPDDVLVSLDMVQGYYHVDLHPTSRALMGFAWRGKYYVYNVFPFGMTT